MDLKSRAAYHGPNWKIRSTHMTDEIRQGAIWAPYTCNSEWAPLQAVLLYLPGAEIEQVKDTDAALHLRPIDHRLLEKQHRDIVRQYESCGVKVHLLDAALVDDIRRPNVLFQRDLFWQTCQGAVVARMASPVRAGEERYATATLAGLGVPIALTVGGWGTFEGADCLWLGPHTVLCGVGNRTNEKGYDQIRNLLELQGVSCIPVPVPPHVQHLLGCVQIVSPNRAFVRVELASTDLLSVFDENGLHVVPVAESREVVEELAFNFVVVDRNSVIMTSQAPKFRRFLEQRDIKIAGSVSISEYVNAAGGLACATGILARAMVTND
jgi:N-dimethylarginine dimethylaminohydrolase